MRLEDIKRIGILGAGVMGGGIAQCAIQAGQRVIVRDLSVEICENARDVILNSRFGFNKVDEMIVDRMMANLHLIKPIKIKTAPPKLVVLAEPFSGQICQLEIELILVPIVAENGCNLCLHRTRIERPIPNTEWLAVR